MISRILSLAAVVLAAASALPAQAQTSSSPHTRATRYDAMGRVTGTIMPNSPSEGYNSYPATRTTYDNAGRRIKVESGRLNDWQSDSVAPEDWAAFTAVRIAETTYNALGQKLTERVKGKDGATWITYALTQYTYDAAGRLQCTAVRMNPDIFDNLPSSACTIGVEGTLGPDRITKHYYDVAGQLIQVRMGAGTPSGGAEVTYSYTPSGKIEHVVDARGNRALMCYDGYDRQVRWVFPSTVNPVAYSDWPLDQALSSAGEVNGACTGSTGDYEEYEYDENGNRTSMRKRSGKTLTFEYDALNRNTMKIVPGSSVHVRDVFYSYDLRGLMTSARFDSDTGEGVLFTYDGFGRKTSETSTLEGAEWTISSQYDPNGNRTQLTYPDGHYVSYHYDGLNRLYFAEMDGANLFHPTFDSFGRLKWLQRRNTSSGNWSIPTVLTYDGASRVGSMLNDPAGTTYDNTTTFNYNPAGQIASLERSNDEYAFPGYLTLDRNYARNGLNQYSAVAGTNFAYDADGNLTSDGVDTYTYDAENRLVTRSGSASITLRYDPLGRLYKFNPPGPLRHFLYDGDTLVAEYNANDTVLRRYVHGTSARDDPLVWFEGAGVSNAERRYLYADERGSIVAVAGSGGSVINVNRYDEYGIPASGNDGAFQYTGQVWLPELGMYYFKARMYSPTLGRFMQTDPIGYEDQFNLYAYAMNDPINLVDPSGQCAGAAVGEPVEVVVCGGAVITWGLAALAGVATWMTNNDDDVPASDRTVTRNDNGGPRGPDPARIAIPEPSELYARVHRRANSLDTRHRDAAIREARGEVVARRGNGIPYDHIGEIRQTANGLRRDIQAIDRQLARQSGLSHAERETLLRARGRASVLLDLANRTLQRTERIRRNDCEPIEGHC